MRKRLYCLLSLIVLLIMMSSFSIAVTEEKKVEESIQKNNINEENQTTKQESMNKKNEITQIIQNGTYVISSAMNSKLVLDVTDNSTKAGANIEIWDKNNQNNQKFNVTYIGEGYYKMEVVSSGKYLSATSEKPKNEDNVIQNTYQDKDNQKWIIKEAGNGYYYIISKAQALYLDIYAAQSRSGANVELYGSTQGMNQKFKFNKVNVVTGAKSIKNGTYTINSAVDYNQVIDICAASKNNKANALMYTRTGGNNQRFKIEYLEDGYYKIIANHSGKALTVENSSVNVCANVSQEDYIGIDSQKWVIKNAGGEFYSIISKCNGLYLDLEGGTAKSETNVEVYSSNNQNWQRFKFTSVDVTTTKTIEAGNYFITSKMDSNKVIDVEGNISTNNTNIEIWEKNNGNNQRFIVVYLKDGYYTIKAFNSNKVLTVQNSSYISGANVVQTFFNNSDSQKWSIQEASDGYYYIINKLNGLALDIEGAVSKNGTNVEVYEKNSGKNQMFKFTKTEFTQTINNGKYMIMASSNKNKVIDIENASKENGANVELWEANGGTNQSFNIEYIGNGYYTIEALCSKKLLTLKNGNIIQQEDNKSDEQKWTIQKEDNSGNFSIRCKSNDAYMDIYGNNMSNGTNIRTTAGNGQNSQKFKFESLLYKGIDVSKYNGSIDWKKVSYAGVDFSIIRIGLRGYETGKIVFDDKFKENAENAKANNIKIGAYFVTQAKNYNEGKEEAEQVIKKLAEYKIVLAYPIVVDIEWAGGGKGNNGRADYITVNERTEAAKGFCDTIKNAGYTPMIYANKEWLLNYLDMSKLSKYDVWLAHYVSGAPDKKTDYKGVYTMWQYTSSGKVSGINSDVDLDICYKRYN